MSKNGIAERTATLAVIDYESLVNKGSAEIRKLVNASQTEGMFYLDLRGPRTNSIVDDVPQLLKASNEFFGLPQNCEEKKTQARREGVERG